MTTTPTRVDGVVLIALRGFANPRPTWSRVSTVLFELRQAGISVDTTGLLNLLLARGYVAYTDTTELTITPSGRSELMRLSA